MKVIIAGSRSFTKHGTYCRMLDEAVKESGFEIDEVVSGGAQGIDFLGELWAKCNDKKLRTFIPVWSKYGRSAGPIRNQEMAEYADALIAIWDGESAGTRNMINCMTKLGKPIHEVIV